MFRKPLHENCLNGPELRQYQVMLGRIIRELTTYKVDEYPGKDYQETRSEDFRLCLRERRSYTPALVRLTDGTALLYARQSFLSDRSIRFIFPDSGDVLYHSDSFNVDSQCIPSPAINLRGIENIAKNTEASREFTFVHFAVHDAFSAGWPLERSIGRVANC